ncbi:MAG: hypothetical protein ACREA0_25485, partial [bacterium]
MRRRWWGILLAGMVALAEPPLVLGQQADSRPAGATPDISGVWDGPVGGGGGGGLTGLPGIGRRRWREALPPLQPWAEAILRANRQGVTDPNEQGLDSLDPNNNCVPPGMPRIYAVARPFEIVQSPGRVHILYEWDLTVRRIFSDGRSHPEGYYPTFMGWSIGSWDRDTLVVDTVGISELTWFDGLGTPHSDELRVIERIRRVGRENLEIGFRFEDPKAFTQPWEASKTYELRPDWEILEHVNCEDHVRED